MHPTTILSYQNSIFNNFLAEIRDQNIQLDSLRFRSNLIRMGEIFAYEISKKFEYKSEEIKTPFGISQLNLMSQNVLLGVILRGGLPLHQGFLNCFDKAQSAFVSIEKNMHDESYEVDLEYISSPRIVDGHLILIDSMIGTGYTMVKAYKSLLYKSSPVHTHIVSVIASKEGIEFIKRNLPVKTTSIWIGAVDEELTVKSFIVPGLGNVGDLAYGNPDDEIYEDDEQ